MTRFVQWNPRFEEISKLKWDFAWNGYASSKITPPPPFFFPFFSFCYASTCEENIEQDYF